MKRGQRVRFFIALVAVATVGGLLLVFPPPPDDEMAAENQSTEQPRTGWGENNRAWGDDEFWMDMTTAGLQGLFTLLTIGGAVWLYRRQRHDSKQDALQEEYEALTDDMGTALQDVSGQVRLMQAILKKGPTDESRTAVWKAYEAMRPQVARLEQFPPKLESDFPIVAYNVRRAAEALDQ